MTSDHIWYFVATGTPWEPHGMALNHTDSIKVNVEIQILYLECQCLNVKTESRVLYEGGHTNKCSSAKRSLKLRCTYIFLVLLHVAGVE